MLALNTTYELVDAALESVKTERSTSTARMYSVAICDFLDAIGFSEITSRITFQNFIDYPTQLTTEGYSKSTLRVYTAGVKFLLNFLVIHGYLSPSYEEILRLNKAYEQLFKKQETRLPKIPDKDAVGKMIEASKIRKVWSPIKERDIAMVLFFSSSGCRNDEVAHLLVGDLDLSDNTALICGKGNKERIAFFSQEAADAIQHYWGVRGWNVDSDPAFARHDKKVSKRHEPMTTTAIRNTIDHIRGIAGLAHFTPHWFRHAFAMKVLHETKDIKAVQDLLGHSSITATQIYAKISQEDLQETYHGVFK